MSYYCPVDELASRIIYLSTTYPKYRHRFPLLSWSYQNDELELLERLTQHNISARLVKGPYYDSYAEDPALSRIPDCVQTSGLNT